MLLEEAYEAAERSRPHGELKIEDREMAVAASVFTSPGECVGLLILR
jgi:hypothetical protein